MQTINTVPFDTDVILVQKYDNKNMRPLVVVGEVIHFKNKVHYLWYGGYEETVNMYEKERGIKFAPTHWLPL